jgi:ABC-2 type transport system ATP-binding protein
MDALVIENVSKRFGATQAVDGLSLRVPQGQVCGVLGPNGAGKTTSIRMIMNIIRPDSGSITVLGSDAGTTAKIRIGYMPEERGLYRKMTVRRTLEYFGSIKGVSGQDLSGRIPRWLGTMDLEAWAERKVEELSRGMNQKLQFIVTVINEPEVLILDEPSSGLDPVNQELLKSLIMKMRDEGKTIVFSTHIMHDAEQICDSIALINKGKLVLEGKLQEVRSRFRSQGVRVEAEGAIDFIDKLPFVKSVHRDGPGIDVTLNTEADAQELLKALAGRVIVRKFEVKTPSLHEIFLSLVGGDHHE